MRRQEEQLRQQAHGTGRALLLRQAVLEKKDVVAAANARATSRNWGKIKEKIASAKISEAISSPKFELNGMKYTVLRALGQGGYSQVYEVFDANKSLFALKVVDLSDQSSKTKNDLMKEILFLEKLRKCEYVVQAFEYQIKETNTDNSILVLLEKGDKDLNGILERVKRGGGLTSSRLRFYWEQMLVALQEVHGFGIIHADVKPANFLMVSGQLKIIDFGLACELPPGQDYVVRRSVVGTKEFMSPEVVAALVKEKEGGNEARETKITTKVDVWALGIILYHAVYNQYPFNAVPGGKQSRTQALSSLSHPVAFNDQETLEPELLDTMRRCLEKNPSRRATVNQSCKMSKLIRYMHWVQIMRTTQLNSKIFTQLVLFIRSGKFCNSAVEELLTHPYLHPEHRSIEQQSWLCNTCRITGQAMAKVNFKRERRARKAPE